MVHDKLTVVSIDGTASQIIDVTITGTNDTAAIGGTSTGSVTEAGEVNNSVGGPLTASGNLTVSDADTGQAGFLTPSAASLVGAYGTFTFSVATGAWNYALDATRSDPLTQGQIVHDKLTVKSFDGTASQIIDVTINGTNDAAVISGLHIGTVTEAGGVANSIVGTPTVTGRLMDADVDNPINTFQAVAAGTASAGGYGTYAMTVGGVWTYTLDNAKAVVQALNTTSAPLTDTFTVKSADGTGQVVTITIKGTNDAPTALSSERSAR